MGLKVTGSVTLHGGRNYGNSRFQSPERLQSLLSGIHLGLVRSWHVTCLIPLARPPRTGSNTPTSASITTTSWGCIYEEAKRLYPYRTDDRCRDHRNPAAIALPAYQDYTVRGRVSEAMVAASAAKTVVAENAANGSALNSGWTAPTATNNVASVAVAAATGNITVTTTDKAGGGTIILLPPLTALR